jgi:transposase InsO family protein
VVYRFIDDNKKVFGLRWLCRKFNLSTNAYYNYKKNKKDNYYKKKNEIKRRIKYLYYNNNRIIGYRMMRIFLKRYGYSLSNKTVHKYMNKELGLCSVIMRKKGKYKTGHKNKIFNNLLKQDFKVEIKNKIWCTDFTYMRTSIGKFRFN